MLHVSFEVNDLYDTAYSTKDELQVQGMAHVPNVYMKFNNPLPSARTFKTLLCSTNNKRRLQKLICKQLTELAQTVHAEIVYSVGSSCTNLSTLESMPDYSFSQSEADTILFSAYAVLRDSGYSGPVVIDLADTDTYVAAAVISHKLPGLLCIKRKQETILCRNLVPEEMHCTTTLPHWM